MLGFLFKQMVAGTRTAGASYHLTLAATGDPEEASEARARFCGELMRQEQKVPLE